MSRLAKEKLSVSSLLPPSPWVSPNSNIMEFSWEEIRNWFKPIYVENFAKHFCCIKYGLRIDRFLIEIDN